MSCRILTYACVQPSGVCGGKEYQFMDDAPFTPDGFLPRWTPDVEISRLGMPCLVNELARVFSPVRLYSNPGAAAPEEDVYLEAMQCSQVNPVPQTPNSKLQITIWGNHLRIMQHNLTI